MRSVIQSGDLHGVGVYKAVAPEDTIARIRALLRRSDLFVIERHWNLSPGHWASVHLQIPGTGFAVNGKGIDARFALASAYGELMERLQFLYGLGLAYPDQELIAEAPLAAWPTDLTARLARIAAGSRKATGDGVPVVPFYHLGSGELRLLPIEALRQSALTNGCCAGNTPPEALIHGICEILERFVLRRIVVEQPVLPSIPVAELRGFPVHATLAHLQRQGLEVIVKDCSFGGAWPVVGLILRQGERGIFHVGASPSFPLALERCLTEVFQGIGLDRLIAKLPPLPTAAPRTDEEASLRFVRAAKNIERLVEPCLLESSGGYAVEYVQRSRPDMVSDATLKALLRRIGDAGHEVYVRDIGFLGFPSFILHISGMSTLQDEAYHRHSQTEARERLAALYMRLDEASTSEVRWLAESIRRWLGSPVRHPWQSMQESLLGLTHGPSVFDAARTLQPTLIAALLFDESGDPQAGATLLQAALTEQIATGEIDGSPGSQFSARIRFGAYLAARGQGATSDTARQRAFAGALDPISRRLELRLSGRIGRLETLHVPRGCYHCSLCSLATACEAPGQAQLAERLHERMRHFSFDQGWLSTLLD